MKIRKNSLNYSRYFEMHLKIIFRKKNEYIILIFLKKYIIILIWQFYYSILIGKSNVIDIIKQKKNYENDKGLKKIIIIVIRNVFRRKTM